MQSYTNMESHLLTSLADVQRFAFAGNATLTLASRATGARFTYKFQQPKDKLGQADAPTWVRLLTGPDNEGDYRAFMGTIWNRGTLSHTKSGKVQVGNDAPSMKALDFFIRMLNAGQISEHLEIWHEGRCGRCNRKLTVPESIANGIGPECAKIAGI